MREDESVIRGGVEDYSESFSDGRATKVWRVFRGSEKMNDWPG